LALQEGLDLTRLVAAGHPQPFHVRDLETLRAMPRAGTPATSAPAACSLTASVATDGFAGFADWAADAHGLTDADALLAGLAGAGLAAPCTITVERLGRSRSYTVPAGRSLASVTPCEDAPDLVLRDLRGTPLRSVSMGAGDVPALTLMDAPGGLNLTLECSAAQMDAQAAIALLTQFAGGMEQPLRHLL